MNDRLSWWKSFWNWLGLDLMNALLIQLKELIFLKVIAVKNAWFVTIGFLIMVSNFKFLYANGCHDLMMLYLNISDIAVKNVNDFCIIHNM